MATTLGNERGDGGGADARRYWGVFTEAEHRQMINDDLQAGTTVAMLLTAVIFAGLLIGLTGVLLSL